MSNWRNWLSLALFGVAFLAVPSSAVGQDRVGSVEGVVRDESGAVLPGVTVEVSSPSLIEGTRSVVTDSTGSYRVLQLPPGTYAMKFSLTGFATVDRPDVILNAGFTATINQALKVGSVSETVTVNGQSPIVDVTNSVTQTVLTADAIATIPTARSVFDMTKLISGVTTTIPDVGGSNAVFYQDSEIHGSLSNNRGYYNDGQPVGVFFSGGDAPRYYEGTAAQQEVDYAVDAQSAEVAQGGISINMVTKDGGDKFSGSVFANGANKSLESSNLTSDLMARGVKATSGVGKVYDFDATFGGPVIKKKLWFFGAGRAVAVDQLLANQFFQNGTQADNFERDTNDLGKVTWHINDDYTLAAKYEHDGSYRPYRRQGATFVTTDASALNVLRYSDVYTGKWTGTPHGWVLEAAGGMFRSSAARDFRPETLPGAIAQLDLVTSTLSGAPLPSVMEYDHPLRGNLVASVTRLANYHGQHEIKAGTQNTWANYDVTYDDQGHGDMQLQFRNGVPDSAVLYNTPLNSNPLVAEHAFYIEDSWKIANRLTINAGLRNDNYHLGLEQEVASAGTWVPARNFPAVQTLVDWHNVVPRLGIVYDPFGSGKTAIKASFGKYMGVEGVSVSDAVNPMFVSTNTCQWNGVGGDGLAAVTNNLSRCSGFAGGVTTTVAPGLRRPFDRDYSGGIHQQLFTDMSVSVMYYRRENRDNRGIENLGIPTASYVPVTITNPITGQPLTLYNQAPSTVGSQQNILVNSPLLDSNYNGIEFEVQRRFSTRASLIAGYTYGRTTGSILATQTFTSVDLNDPNNLIFSQGRVGDDETHQFKASGSYELPAQVSLSGVFLGYTGLPYAPTLVVSRTLVPTLTRASQTVRLEPNTVNSYNTVTLLDLRLGRVFAWGTGRRLEPFFDAYNIFNRNTVLGQVTTFGPSFGNVSSTVNPRIMKVGVNFNF